MAASGFVLSAFVQTHLRALDESDARGASDVRKQLAESGVLERIEGASRLAWISVDDHVELCEAIRERLGSAAARAICRRMVLRSLEQPFLGPLFSAAVGVSGGSFARFAPWTARSWPALYRGTGTMRWSARSGTEGEFRLLAAPARIRESAAYVEGLAGGLEALLEATESTGQVAEEVEDGDVRFCIAWGEDD